MFDPRAAAKRYLARFFYKTGAFVGTRPKLTIAFVLGISFAIAPLLLLASFESRCVLLPLPLTNTPTVLLTARQVENPTPMFVSPSCVPSCVWCAASSTPMSREEAPDTRTWSG